MSSLVKEFTARLGWHVARGNVIVEGTSDVKIIELAAKLYKETHEIELLGEDLSVIAAGLGDEGGVNGINKRYQAIRQIAAAETAFNQRPAHRFIALYDNDRAGREAIGRITDFDVSISEYSEVFLLHPVMPLKNGTNSQGMKIRFERDNSNYRNLDWEIEDLISEDLLLAFEAEAPGDVSRKPDIGGLTHRNFTRDGKYKLLKFIETYATLKDLSKVIALIKALRDYCHLQHDHIIIP
ncbi:hypothetical protein [Pseudomonas urmiensis]|uniref:hypothetical protein n=1 Tax=Pseudomonas urmiensis TaxID=2745493 RepID=UPI003D101135